MELVYFLAAKKLGSADELGLPTVSLDDGLAGILKALYMLAGGLGLIFVIIGGLRYVLSNGDPKDIALAKGTIIYAIIGLAIALTAFTAVSFITQRLGG